MRYWLAALVLLFLTPFVSGIISASAHIPENAANKSDFVVHGNVTDIGQKSDIPEFKGADIYHPVEIQIKEMFKGETAEDTITVHVKGGTLSDGRRMDVSTAAKFSEGEKVVVMLEEHEERLYMETGYASKYEVENNTIELAVTGQRNLTPQNITLQEMKETVQNTADTNYAATYAAPTSQSTNEESSQNSQEQDKGLVKRIIDAIIFF